MDTNFVGEQPNPNLGNRIRLLRESLKFSQEYVAAKLNVSQQAYSRMENAPMNITIKRMFELATIFGVSLHVILCEGNLKVLQELHATDGKNVTSIQVHGMSENERHLYESRINDLIKQVQILQDLLMKK